MEKFVIKNIERPETHIVDEFQKLEVSTVYEAQEKQGLMGYELRPLIQGSKICGPAVTAICYAGDNLMIHAAIEVVKPGDILVVSTIGQSHSGMIGELIVTALIKRGVAGVVIDSGIRDAARLREMGFPVWSRGIYSEGTTKTKAGWVNGPAVCGGTLVQPGDLIMADDDGVVVVTKDDLLVTLESSKQRVEKERVTKKMIFKGELSVDFYNLRPVLEQAGVVYYEDQFKE